MQTVRTKAGQGLTKPNLFIVMSESALQGTLELNQPFHSIKGWGSALWWTWSSQRKRERRISHHSAVPRINVFIVLFKAELGAPMNNWSLVTWSWRGAGGEYRHFFRQREGARANIPVSMSKLGEKSTLTRWKSINSYEQSAKRRKGAENRQKPHEKDSALSFGLGALMIHFWRRLG